jgi:acetamidase/formamidase
MGWDGDGSTGALFSVGDGHAVQGDGEVCVTALECSLEGVFRLTVRKDLGVAGTENGTSWVPAGASRPNQVRTSE